MSYGRNSSFSGGKNKHTHTHARYEMRRSALFSFKAWQAPTVDGVTLQVYRAPCALLSGAKGCLVCLHETWGNVTKHQYLMRCGGERPDRADYIIQPNRCKWLFEIWHHQRPSDCGWQVFNALTCSDTDKGLCTSEMLMSPFFDLSLCGVFLMLQGFVWSAGETRNKMKDVLKKKN